MTFRARRKRPRDSTPLEGRASGEDQALAAARLEYTRLAAERDRLRAARAFFARQLGPLPAVGGLSLTTAGLLVGETSEDGTWVCLALVGAIVVVGIAFSNMSPYRKLRVKAREDLGDKFDTPCATEAEWYERESELERKVYAKLETALWYERWGLFLTQALLVAIVVVLVIAHTPADKVPLPSGAPAGQTTPTR